MITQPAALFLLFVGKFDTKVVTRDIVAASILAVPLAFFTPLPAHSTAMQQQQPAVEITSSEENYLPRLLYPGTYKNFCGPTPETTIKDGCRAHGWHGDDALDSVDNACRLHDVAYCHCEADLMTRRRVEENKNNNDLPPMLSSMVALRFVTNPVLQAEGVDSEYFDCVHKADKQLIATGVRIRGEQQRMGCNNNNNNNNDDLKWFCSNDKSLFFSKEHTLAAFEKVNLSIFLKDLDADEKRRGAAGTATATTAKTTLTQMEKRRHDDLMANIQSGKGFPDAAMGPVQEDEEQMLQKLTTTGD